MSKLKRKYLRASIVAVAITAVLLLTLTAAPAMAQWTPDSDIASGLEGIGKNSAPAVFSMDEMWYLIAGEYDGVFTGYNWTGTEWQSDPTVIFGLLDVGYYSAPAVFNKDGTWYLIAGEYDGVFTGYNWSGTVWQSDPAIALGLGGIGKCSAPVVFDKGGTWYLIAGEKEGVFYGYVWNETGSTWQSDPRITSGLTDIGDYSTPTVFEMTLHLISGNKAGAFNGYNWIGTEWQSDPAIIEGLTDVGDYSAPAVFEMDSTWYLISGNKAGTFNGYKFTAIPTMTPEELFELLAGGWEFEGNMTIGEMIIPTNGTRTVILTDSTTADFVAIMEGEEEAETGEAWWDADMEKLVVEGEEEAFYYDLLENGFGGTYELPEGIPEMGIFEPVFCVYNETFVDEDTLVLSWVVRNATGVVLASYEATYTRTDEWHVVEGISIQDAIDNAAEGDTVIVHEGIYEEQLYVAKSLMLQAAEGESPEIRAPEPETLESYGFDFEMFPGFTMPISVTPIIMVNGSSDDINVNISDFVIDGSSVTIENSEYGICGIFYLNADGTIESNEIKNIWGLTVEEEPPHVYNGMDAFVYSDSSNAVTIHGNALYDDTGVGSGGAGTIGVVGGGTETRVEATVTENTVTGAKSPDFPDTCGIFIYNAIATVNDNIVSGYIYTDEWWYACGISVSGTNLTAQGNTLIGSGIWVNTGCGFSPSTAFIEGNTIDASGVSEGGCGPIAGIAITTFPPCGSYEEEPSLTAIVEGNQLIGGPGSGIVIGGIGEMMAEGGLEPVGTVTATITRNTVSDWDCGIELLNCSNSTIYLNDFVNNTQNVLVSESTNAYSSPEKLGYTYEGRDYTSHLGNYWSDFAGEDANANGIGDTSHEITGDNQDSYPLMHSEENYEQIGILVVAHGYYEDYPEDWCGPVRDAVEEMTMPYPTELGFLEFVPNQTINIAVDKLDEEGVTKIIAVPLFISSHSSHIAEIEYVLGLRETLPGSGMMSSSGWQTTVPETSVISSTRTFLGGVEMERSVISREGRYYISYTPISEGISAAGVSVMQHGGGEEELVPVDTPAEIVLTGAIDNHTLIAQILADRAAELCSDPTNETVVLVAHGTYNEAYFQGWLGNSRSLAEKVKLILRYSKGIEIEDVRCSFFFANPHVHPDLVTSAVVEDVSETSHPIVVPMMVSNSSLTNTAYLDEFPWKLAGLNYTYCEKQLTPHPNIANWIEVTAAKELTYPTIPIYNDSQLLDISIEEVGAYHGDVCICLALGFRGTQLAIAELWDGEVPHRGDIRVISASPTKGINDAFEYILNSTEDVVIELPEGTDKVNLTSDNFRVTIIRKSTNDSVTIQVKEGVFPDGFFELRKKVKFGIPENATAEEKKAFKLLWKKTMEKAMYKPMNRIFEIVPPEKIGILAIAHGSSSESWCAPIRDAVENVSWTYPIELGFLEKVPNETISDAVDNLDEENVTKIIAVPLFISSSSGHIAEIEYMLGLRETPPEGEEGLVQVNTTAEIALTSAMDNHSLIAQILTDRAAKLSVNATNETVVIVAHGTKTNETQFEGWDASSASLAEKVRLMLRHSKGHNIKDVRYSFINVNGTLHPDLGIRTVVEDVSTTSNPIVVPLMISEGYHTNRKIPKLLKNLSYAYPAEGERALTPHGNVANWIEITAYKEFIEEFGYPTVQIYDGVELLGITIEDVGEYHGEGEIEICPCVVCAFRSTLRAFSEEELWDGVPRRGDVKIISAHPSDGHRMTFEYILNSTEDVVIQSPTDIKNITAENFVYTFINKTTNESITLRVKEDIFPERFFELRTKKKLGTATPEEKKALKLLWEKLKEKAMYKPLDKVFDTPVQTAINNVSGGEHQVF